MRFSFFCFFVIILGVSAHANSIQVSGNVSGNWNVDTVQVVGDLIVPFDQILHINEGVKVIFQGYYLFKVEGQITANGTKNDSILFQVSDTTGFHNLESTQGSWSGFWFEPKITLSDSSIFEYCRFNYSKAVSSDSTFWYGGAVFIKKYSLIRFSNCTFENNRAYKNGGAIYCNASDIKIEHCDFIHNSCGTQLDYGYGGGVCLEYSNSVICNSYFTQNSSSGVGGGLSFEYSDPRIENNVFSNNQSGLGGGLCCLRSEKGNSIVNNLFNNNYAVFFGGGVAFLEAHSLFVNNTVINNQSMYGGGLYFNAGAKPQLYNCIVWNNGAQSADGPQAYIFDVYSGPEFYYCDIEGGFENFSGSGIGNFQGVYENNLDLDPLFIGSGNTPYELSENSPCINSGKPDTIGLMLPIKDLADNNRIKDDHIDMGCYESQGNFGVQSLMFEEQHILITPNPIRNEAVFHLYKTKLSANTRVLIFNSNGVVVRTFYIENKSSISWNVTDDSGNKLPSGIYFSQVLDAKVSYISKLVINN